MGQPGRKLAGYPEEWPLVAWFVKSLSGWSCEHCGAHLPPGAGENLTVHHLDRRPNNLQSWNLVPLCFSCHGLVGRLVQDLDIEQLSLLGEPLFPWFAGAATGAGSAPLAAAAGGAGRQGRPRTDGGCLRLGAGLRLWVRAEGAAGDTGTDTNLCIQGLPAAGLSGAPPAWQSEHPEHGSGGPWWLSLTEGGARARSGSGVRNEGDRSSDAGGRQEWDGRHGLCADGGALRLLPALPARRRGVGTDAPAVP